MCSRAAFQIVLQDALHYVLAAVATVVVRRTCKLVLNNRVEQYQLVADRLEWEVFKLTAAAVEAHEATFLAKYTCKLVHDTAVDTAVVVLSGLAGKNHIPLRNLIVAKEVVECISIAALKGG